MIKDFIEVADFTGVQLQHLLDRAAQDKQAFRAGRLPASLQGATLAMVFEKPSLRTRVSFETAMTQLGGHALYLTQKDIGLGLREPAKDVARVLGRMCQGIMARTFSHALVQELARWSPVPVINALTDLSHPCQALADLMTVRERFGSLAGKTLAFIGDGNNVARSLAVACSKLGMRFVLSCPKGYELKPESIVGLDMGAFQMTCEPGLAVSQAEVIYTDTWISMGQEAEKARRLNDFAGFQVNADLLALAPKGAIVMHCLPAYRGYEISEQTFEAFAEVILDQAENRLHFQRSLLTVLLAEGGIA
ncbi:MAG: ornithine carbamoyltransferase [Planctomycetota bacterium]